MSTHLKTLAVLLLTLISCMANAQPHQGGTFGFGLILGDPTGGTIKVWLDRSHAIDAYIGGDYFGSPRLGGDYLWNFNAFNSDVASMYAGPGISFGFGHGEAFFLYNGKHDVWIYRPDGGLGVAIRAIIGVNVTPRRTPIEIFFEVGPLIGIAPGFGAGMDAALGIRFYP